MSNVFIMHNFDNYSSKWKGQQWLDRKKMFHKRMRRKSFDGKKAASINETTFYLTS